MLPPPSTDPHVIQNIENPIYQKQISPDFLKKVEYVRKKIFDYCAPKKGFSRGSVVRGFRKLGTEKCSWGDLIKANKTLIQHA